MYVLTNRDLELSCDEKVIQIYGESVRSAYALMLISMEEKKNLFMPLCSNFSKNAIEERIEAIMTLKKHSITTSIAAVCLVGGMAMMFATSAAANGEASAMTVVSEDTNHSVESILPQPTQQELVDLYGAFGISFDTNDHMLFNGEQIRYFCDGVEIEEGIWAIRYEHFQPNGTVDVFSRRSIVDNGDGSYDPFGDLLGLEKSNQEVFEQRNFIASTTIGTTAIIDGESEATGQTFTQLFAKYKEYGIMYEERPGSSGSGNVYYNGETVRTFIDEAPDGGVFSYGSRGGGMITIRTVYDNNGKLIGVEQEAF